MPDNIPNNVNPQDWRLRPPYHTQSSEEPSPIRWRGKCSCGQVTYILRRERPLDAKFCHCRGCQVLHGAPFQWAAIFHKADMTFTNGANGLSFYSSSSQTREHELPTKVSCAFCHSPIMDEGRQVCLVFPESIDYGSSETDWLKWRETFAVSCHIFYSQRAIDIPDGKPKWSGMNRGSVLLDDHGGVMED